MFGIGLGALGSLLGGSGGLTGLLGIINGLGGTIGGIGNLIGQFQGNKNRKKLFERIIQDYDERRAANRAPLGPDVEAAPQRSSSSLYGLTDLLNQSRGQ